jgi:ribosome-associated protein
VRLALEAAADRKAEDPVALNLKGISTFTDCFLILGGNQRRQTQAICDGIIDRLSREGVRPGHVEGYSLGDWILIDYHDLVVHVFTRQTRDFYGLERLWGDAPALAPDRKPARRRAAAARGAAQPQGRRKTSASRKG